MGTYVGSIIGGNSSPLILCDAFNAVTDAIIGCGMQPVDNAELPGQAGVFYAADGSGDTLVGSLKSPPFLTRTRNIVGFNAFKHPTSSLYVVVYYENVTGNWTPQHWGFRFKVASSLVDGELVDLSDEYIGGSLGAGTTLLSVSGSLYASCGEGCFWIAAQPVFRIPATGHSTSTTTLRASELGFYVQELDQGVYFMMTPPVSTGTSNVGMGSVGINYPMDSFGHKQESSIVSRLGSVVGVSATQKSSYTTGIRVIAPAYDVHGGVKLKIGAITGKFGDSEIVNVDLLDAGVTQRYITCAGLGPAAGWYSTASIEDVFIPLLPWPED